MPSTWQKPVLICCISNHSQFLRREIAMNHWRFRVKIGTSTLAHALSLLESDSLVRAYKNGRDDGLPLLTLSHRNNAHIASHLIYLPIRGEQQGEKADAPILLEAPSSPRPQPLPHEELPLDILSTFIDICQGGGAGLGWAGLGWNASISPKCKK